MNNQIINRIKEGILWRIKPVQRFVGRFKKVFIVQNYHRVFDRELCTNFDEGVFAAISQQYLFAQLKWLKREFDILSEDDVIHCLKFKAFPRKSILITFDDGYKDNYTLAYPLLQSLGATAIFFIPTQALVDRQLGWWDMVAYIIKKTSKKSVTIDGECYDLTVTGKRYETINCFIKKFYMLADSVTTGLINYLAVELEVALPVQSMQSDELMTIDELRKMIDNGMSIGAHTHSHKVLSTLSHESQSSEIAASRQILESIFNVKVRSFAYPVGTSYSFDAQTKELVRAHGYTLAFSFYSGVNDPDQIDPFDIRRTFRGHPYEGFLESFREPYTFIRPKL